MSHLKAGIVTIHRCINYGSYWQARRLTEGIQAMGFHSELLDHQSGRVNRAEWKCALQPVLPTSVPESDRPLYRKKVERFFQTFDRLPLSEPFELDHPEAMEYYDVVVIGSDEVWNVHHPWYGNHPLFYGEKINARRIIAYAASCGNFPAEAAKKNEWIQKLRRFDHISVRDTNTQAIVSRALGYEPVLVLDPCLQFPIIPELREEMRYDKPYIAVYGHNFSISFISKINAYARKVNLPLVSIGYRNDWAHEQWITADPHDFVHFITNAQSVITNFFHGCVFAIKYKKMFVTETTSYRSFKVMSLLKTLDAEKYLIKEDTPDDTLAMLLEQPFDPTVTNHVNLLKNSSDNYLASAMPNLYTHS